MARNKKARRSSIPQPPVPLEVVPSELPPEQEPPVDLDLPPLFEDLPDDVPGLEDLFDPETRWREELTGDNRPTEEDLSAESTPEQQALVEPDAVDPETSEEVLDEFRKAIAEPEFDPAPLDPSPPNWEANGEETPPVNTLPATNDAIDALLTENTRLQDENSQLRDEIRRQHDAIGVTEQIVQDAHAETERIRNELTNAEAENIRLTEQLIADSTALGATIEGQLDQLQIRDSENTLLQKERDSLTDQLTAEIAQVSTVMHQLQSMEQAKISVEDRLVDSELTRADLESQLDIIRLTLAEMEATRVDRKLWHITVDVPVGAPVPRLYVLATSITDAIERAVAAGVATAETITNVIEIKGVQLVV